MAKKMYELLWKPREDTANETPAFQVREETSDWLDAWLDEQSELTAVHHARDLATIVPLPEQEPSDHGLSAKTH